MLYGEQNKVITWLWFLSKSASPENDSNGQHSLPPFPQEISDQSSTYLLLTDEGKADLHLSCEHDSHSQWSIAFPHTQQPMKLH